MSHLYRILSALIYFILWPYARLRAASGSDLWRGRLGLIPGQGKIDIWIHAASVGETKIAGYLIDYLNHRKPDARFYLTTMTTAGHNIAAAIKDKNLTTGYFPIDSTGPIKRTFDNINPRLLVIAETEIWPNLIEESHRRQIPIVLVNGRMSDKAFPKYKLVAKMLAQVLSCYAMLFVKSEADKNKFLCFKLADNRIVVAGDMKFDAPILTRSIERIRNTRQLVGASENDFILVAGSTRPGEEDMLLKLFSDLWKSNAAFRLVLVPRHLNRIDEIKAAIAMQNLNYEIYGSNNGTSPLTLVDKMGELDDLYQAADLAFVGGTLVNVGGHNILEPVWAGTPVVFGPHVSNIAEARDYVLANNYGAMVDSIEDLRALIQEFMKNRKMFAIKSEEDLSHSPTAVAGDYILEKLSRV
jgi:3-deoxy-D-manno-octulosonic-acid transferase